MPRVENLGTGVRKSAEEVAELIEEFSADGVIDLDEIPLVLSAMGRHLGKTELVESALSLISCVASSGTETRRAKEHIRGFVMLRGGLPEQFGPGAA